MKNGIVYFVGAGPGDPGLLTIKGKQALKEADVILYDRLANPKSPNLHHRTASLFIAENCQTAIL